MFTQKDLLKTMELVKDSPRDLDALMETVKNMFDFGLINYSQYTKIEAHYNKLAVANGSYIVLTAK